MIMVTILFWVGANVASFGVACTVSSLVYWYVHRKPRIRNKDMTPEALIKLRNEIRNDDK